ncbi:MAG TPA: CHASE3 domain-containing protein, partial [Gemmatimonadaceae bacterium]
MLPKRFVVLALVTLISLVAIGWITDHSTRVMGEAVDSLDHTREVLQQVDQFRVALAAAESSARGYVITGVPSFSSDFQRAALSMRQNLEGLKTLATNDAREQASLMALEALIVSRLDLFRTQVSPNGGQAAQSEIVVKGTMVSRKIGDVLDDIRSEELVHFRRQASRAEAARRFAIYGPWSMCLIAVIILASMLVNVAPTLARAQEIRDELIRAVRKEHTARQSAEEADEVKDQFLATVSHELRTPLTSIIGWCGLLSDEKLRDTLLDEGLASIAQAARVQSQLVEDLLDVSRI